MLIVRNINKQKITKNFLNTKFASIDFIGTNLILISLGMNQRLDSYQTNNRETKNLKGTCKDVRHYAKSFYVHLIDHS